MITLEKRPSPSHMWSWLTPLVAAAKEENAEAFVFDEVFETEKERKEQDRKEKERKAHNSPFYASSVCNPIRPISSSLSDSLRHEVG